MAQQVTEPTTNDITLSNGLGLRYYEWAGNGPNLVLIHPSSGYGRMWDFVARRLNGEFRIYAVDTRGHGDSVGPIRATPRKRSPRTCICSSNSLVWPRRSLRGTPWAGVWPRHWPRPIPSRSGGIMLVGGTPITPTFSRSATG